MIAVLCGGVGAARFLAGLVRVVPPPEVVAIVNVADDTELHGLHISPDLDTVTYTLGGVSDTGRGWGRAGESWRVMEELERFGSVAPPGSGAGATWFRLGDLDLALHLYRTGRLAEGAPLSTVTGEIARAFGVGVRLLPVTDDPLRTVVTTDEGEVTFQEYFVRLGHAVPVRGIRFAGAAGARPAPGVIEALREAEVVVIAPSNPLVSIGPVLAVGGVADALRARRSTVVAVSPIVGGAALKGPADRMLVESGLESSVVGVARVWTGVAGTLVIDHVDADRAGDVAATGMRPVVTGTVMSDPGVAAGLARTVLAAARGQA